MCILFVICMLESHRRLFISVRQKYVDIYHKMRKLRLVVCVTICFLPKKQPRGMANLVKVWNFLCEISNLVISRFSKKWWDICVIVENNLYFLTSFVTFDQYKSHGKETQSPYWPFMGLTKSGKDKHTYMAMLIILCLHVVTSKVVQTIEIFEYAFYAV